MEGKAAARACDYCIGKRARWYCAADDAFLCQACDSSVHSANPLARRHGRVELKTLSIKAAAAANIEPSWHRGFTRKPRTPRHGRYNNNNNNNSKPKTTDAPSPVVHDVVKTPLHLSIVPVPEMCSDENYSHDDEKEDNLLLYRVPIFDPFMTDICTTLNSSNITDDAPAFNESKCAGGGHRKTSTTTTTMPPTTEMEMEMELAEFAADVESLLGKGLDDEEESFDMEGLWFLGGNNVLVVEEKASTMMDFSRRHEKVVVKVEGGEEEDAPACVADDDIFMAANANHHHYTSSSSSLCFDTLELKFDYDNDYSPNNEKEQVSTGLDKEISGSTLIKKTILLNLDYEGVILAWSDQRCPWTTGQRPELNSHHGWPDCIMQRGCGSGTIHAAAYDGVGDMGITLGQAAIADDVGREARVSRYREKRRTRLFSKKIRYEVRKLNAEKRPRMKGRFVKRANFPLLDQQIK